MRFIKDKGKRQPTKLDEFINKNKSYCPMAFREIYVDNAGQYRLCCHATQRDDLKKYQDNSYKKMIFDWINDNKSEIIKDLQSGKRMKFILNKLIETENKVIDYV